MSTAPPLPSATTGRCSRDRELVEDIPELLGRLDEAIGNALNDGIVRPVSRLEEEQAIT
jgi:hypothetical protein